MKTRHIRLCIASARTSPNAGKGYCLFVTEGGVNKDVDAVAERDGFADEVKIEQASGRGATTMPSLGAAVDFVSFLERVYSELNPLVGQRTVAYGMMCDKALDILNEPFDTKALKL